MNFIDLGTVDYNNAYTIQKDLLFSRINGDIEDTVILVEHLPIVTIGRLGSLKSVKDQSELLKKGVKIEFTDRGGDATFHMPGQIVLYPIIDLAILKKDIRLYLDMLEFFLISFLYRVNISAETLKGTRGAWVKGEKIASIGIALKKWVTYHGLSININPDLEYFSCINVCGKSDTRVTSIERHTHGYSVRDLKSMIEEEFKRAFIVKYGFTHRKKCLKARVSNFGGV